MADTDFQVLESGDAFTVFVPQRPEAPEDLLWFLLNCSPDGEDLEGDHLFEAQLDDSGTGGDGLKVLFEVKSLLERLAELGEEVSDEQRERWSEYLRSLPGGSQIFLDTYGGCA